MELELDGTRALVTAASQGLGRASAERLAAEGATVAITSRSRENLEEAREEIVSNAGADSDSVIVRECDLTDEDSIDEGVSAAVDELGGLDALVTNHGGPPQSDFESATLSDLDETYHSVLRSTFQVIQTALPALRDGGGSITNVVSASAREPPKNHLLSNTIRPGIYGLSKTLSREYADDGIRVNCVCPRAVMTERIENLNRTEAERDGISVEEAQQRRVEELAMDRPGDPAEFGRAVAFLASDAASFTTGESLLVDGGWTRSAF
ncbi:SDR family oxidoreductase [Halorussus sp. AFM4]|uniref:SDR family oxidoreductase n=1 Tax=Halorussus sp. AFM4 TaxID=3421651 RepID=UPI003EBFDF8E